MHFQHEFRTFTFVGVIMLQQSDLQRFAHRILVHLITLFFLIVKNVCVSN